MSNSLGSKVIIITGAGKGLGRAYAHHLAALGACIIVNNRSHKSDDVKSADQVVQEITQVGGKAVADYSDVEDPAAGEKLLNLALDQYGRLDGIITNAAISESRSFHNQSIAEFAQVIDINLMGTARILHPVFKHMYESGSGAIVISTSVAGLYGEHGLPAYSASKAALLGLMYSLSQEGRSHNIKVNALSPFAATQMTDASLTPDMMQHLHANKVSPVAAWLLSDSCKLSGEIIITGAGKITRAQMRQSTGILIPDIESTPPSSLDEYWQTLTDQSLDFSYRNAIAQFQAFIADTMDKKPS